MLAKPSRAFPECSKGHCLPGLIASILLVLGACQHDLALPEFASTARAIESCTGGTDDDLDGLIDCVDPDCAAEPSCAAVFACDRDLFQIANGALHRINPSQTPFLLDPVATATGNHNSMGYNPRDGLLYMLAADETLRRIDRSGAEQNLGAVANLPDIGALPYFVGDFDLDGNLWVVRGASGSNTVYRIDVSARVATDLGVQFTDEFKDWAYNPDDSKFYSVHDDNLFIVDPDPTDPSIEVHALTGEHTLDTGYTGNHGAAFFDSNGILFVITNSDGATRAIDIRTFSARMLGRAQSATENDGASCALAPSPFEVCNNGIDDDGDGAIDENSVPPEALNTCVDVPDTDDDGIPDGVDLDDDNDGIPDVFDGPGDTDRDGIADRRDLDSDNDGISDLVEAGHDGDDSDRDGMVDGDVGANGLADQLETGPDEASLDYDSNSVGGDLPANSDGDGAPDFQDLDSDGDSLSDLVEFGYDPDGIDSDGDGAIDLSADADRDGIQDPVDGADDYGDDETGTGQSPDTDSDTIPDFRDIDSDGDLISDSDEAGDSDLATGPVDSDNDGTPDYRDLDSDGDTIPDTVEAGDSDLDTDPVDTDRDNRPDFVDVDSDGDDVSDTDEVGQDVNQPVDTDGDSTPDFRDIDSDDDNIGDKVDNCRLDRNPDQTDLDRDGLGLACDNDEIRVAGGGCSAQSGTRGPGSVFPIYLVFLALFYLARRRRQAAASGTTFFLSPGKGVRSPVGGCASVQRFPVQKSG